MTLSIIIVNYNTFALTSACISSVLRFVQGLEYEILLVDNASTERPATDFLETFSHIQLIPSPENVGFAKGNNLGLAQARGEFLLLLNSDTELLDNALCPMLAQMQADPKIGALSCRLIFPDGRVQHVANRFPSLRLELLELFRGQKLMSAQKRGRVMQGFFFDHRTRLETDWIWGAFFLTRRAVIDQLPGKKLPDDYFMYFEDVQWGYQIRKLGYKVVYDPSATVVHHFRAVPEPRPTGKRKRVNSALLPKTRWLFC
ncbi:MAG: glycosyltransferase family 2 protein [Microscillaceae bacterium]|nr:glycosyltransferase family 2 protein [Microscillaceae bacterium]